MVELMILALKKVCNNFDLCTCLLCYVTISCTFNTHMKLINMYLCTEMLQNEIWFERNQIMLKQKSLNPVERNQIVLKSLLLSLVRALQKPLRYIDLLNNNIIIILGKSG